jgi:hypothetical protein
MWSVDSVVRTVRREAYNRLLSTPSHCLTFKYNYYPPVESNST